jgi:hypothetical protein
VKVDRRSASARLLTAAVAAGSVYAGIASARLSTQLFAKPPATGRSASIDEQFAPLRTTAGDIRAAVERAGWPVDADIALIVDVGEGAPVTNAAQVQYALSYVLYPKRIWLEAPPRPVHRAIFIGTPNGPPSARVHGVSPLLTLVDLE